MGNFRVEPPGLFRGRGEHPKMGMIKRRIYPRDITINIGALPHAPCVLPSVAGKCTPAAQCTLITQRKLCADKNALQRSTYHTGLCSP